MFVFRGEKQLCLFRLGFESWCKAMMKCFTSHADLHTGTAFVGHMEPPVVKQGPLLECHHGLFGLSRADKFILAQYKMEIINVWS